MMGARMKTLVLISVSLLAFCSAGCSPTRNLHDFTVKADPKEATSAPQRSKDCTSKPNYAGMIRTLCY